jgi:hypothetical protein
VSTTVVRRAAGVTDLIQAGMTYRQIDYAVTHGYLRTVQDANPGVGKARQFPWGEVRIAEVMVKLTDAGIGVAQAAALARSGADGAAVLRRLADLVEGVAA